MNKNEKGKKDVTGGYSSDVFLHAPDVMFSMLAEVFKLYLVHGTVSKQILVCAFLPLYKRTLNFLSHTELLLELHSA